MKINSITLSSNFKVKNSNVLKTNRNYVSSLSFRGDSFEISQKTEVKTEEEKSNLDTKVAGYQKEKQLLEKIYVNPIKMEQEGYIKSGAPNSIILCDLKGGGSSVIARAMAQDTNSNFVNLSANWDDFSRVVQDELETARQRYFDTKQRTLILVNNADEYLKETRYNRENIAMMKSWLDNCAGIPGDNNNSQNAYATTFLFVTSKPADITDEIFNRCEKVEDIIALEAPCDDELKEIIQFYVDKYDKRGDILGRQKVDYNTIVKKLNPDENGAYSLNMVSKIIKLALDDSSRNLRDKKSFSEYINKRINEVQRDITPEELNEYDEQTEDIL